jgi:hypothetical protein
MKKTLEINFMYLGSKEVYCIFSSRGLMCRLPLCLRRMREADVLPNFFKPYSSRTLDRMLEIFTRLQRVMHLVP